MAKGGREVIRTDIQVGDDTRRFFHVSIWQKQMASMAVAGDIVLLQSKIHFLSSFLSFGGRTCGCLFYLSTIL